MENEERKEWTVPELKKVSIDDLTAREHLLHPEDDDGGKDS